MADSLTQILERLAAQIRAQQTTSAPAPTAPAPTRTTSTAPTSTYRAPAPTQQYQAPAAPAPAPTASRTSSTYSGPSIVDYLNSVGQSSSYSSRAQLASQYGIQNYTGTAAQNTQLLGTLRGGASSTIPASTLGSSTPLNFPSPLPTNTADMMVAGATSASTQMTAEQQALQSRIDADQSKYDKLSGEINTLLGSATGQGAATLAAENAAGVPQMQQQLQGINSQITTKLAEFKVIQDKYAETIQAGEQRTIPMENIIGRTAEINRSLALQKNTFASEIGLLQAQAQLVQGNLQLAKETANRAVELKYQDIKTQIQVKMQQLDLIRDSLTASERKQAAALDQQYRVAESNLSIQVANEKDKNATLLDALRKYPDAGISLQDTIEQANAKIVSNSALYQDEIRVSGGGGSPIGGGTSGGTTTGKALSTGQLTEFKRLYGWTPPPSITLAQATQFMKDNPGASPTELEAAANKALGLSGPSSTSSTTPDAVISYITSNLTAAQKTALKQKADAAGLSSMWRTASTDIKNYLNSIKDQIQQAIEGGYTQEEILAFLAS